jgi:uncharacterized membrane protein
MNGFYIYMLLTSLLIPVIMLVFGWIFRRQAPKKINVWYGYRSARSMKNEDTWVFAHQHIGRTLMIAGAVLLSVNLSKKKFVLDKGEVEIPRVEDLAP